jgi:hypothetical protein
MHADELASFRPLHIEFKPDAEREAGPETCERVFRRGVEQAAMADDERLRRCGLLGPGVVGNPSRAQTHKYC